MWSYKTATMSTLSLSRIAVADDPAGYPVDDRCPASRHFSVNHTDFPASNSTTPQSCQGATERSVGLVHAVRSAQDSGVRDNLRRRQ